MRPSVSRYPRRSVMNSWHDRRILDLFGIDLPILRAPMAGVSTPPSAPLSAGLLSGALVCLQHGGTEALCLARHQRLCIRVVGQLLVMIGERIGLHGPRDH